MRRSRQDAAATRERILKSAAAEFRRNGIDGTGLADLMAAAGLTHGGFYKHFGSKEQIVAEACAEAANSLTNSLSAIAGRTKSKVSLEDVVGSYLSRAKRDSPADSCPLAMMGSELARQGAETRDAASGSFLKLTRLLVPLMPDAEPEVKARNAMVAMCAMIGALTVARIVPEESLSDAILSEMTRAISTGQMRGSGKPKLSAGKSTSR
ncbi:TetR/AcrR family transcriptional repressor of nem operon [Silvibacterium bohemicum]|uniref:TetR/AcrR family transcriptional repressor of nem operon n=1 Tax=Silvibacterium bohemicum TaxID=1577686 RepID=A0A841K2A0_9BACT|nr:TetR/AcrR family transcriptional regulator [Silvibacterium bohemicum]MBB6145291.1 TetR/AcrR family transcriptional repressor of nem operon [Silvibacterium bohemicum]